MTDSAVTVTYHDKIQLLDMFEKEIGDKKNDYVFTEGALPMLLMTVYLAAVKLALREYAHAINIDPELVPMIDLECEIVMEQEHLSISKKNYAFITVVKDFILKMGKMETRGFKFKKSDANADIAEQVEDDVYNKIMCKVSELDYKNLINHVHKITSDTANMIKTDDFIINKKSIVKVGDVDDISWGDTRMKAVRLWDRLFPETPVELPGAFGIIRVKLDDDIVDHYKVNKPDVYRKMYYHCEELYKYGVQNKVINKVAKILDSEDDDNIVLVSTIRDTFSESAKVAMRKICSLVGTKYSDRDPNQGLYDDIMKLIEDETYLSDKDISTIKKLFGITSKGFVPDDEIVKSIDRIAVPIDINSVPDILKEDDYRIIDIEACSEYEHLLAPLLNTTSLSVIKNKSKNAVITSVLQVF